MFHQFCSFSKAVVMDYKLNYFACL